MGDSGKMLWVRDNDKKWSFANVALPEGTSIERWASINSSGVIAAIGNGGHALLLLPVDYQQVSPNSGFDGANLPPWLMVPQNGNNFAKVYTPASSTLPLDFRMVPATSKDTCSPTTTTTSPKTITVNGVKAGEGSSVQVSCGTAPPNGYPLRVAVKPYQYKYVELHEIVQRDGIHPDVRPRACPSAAALEAYLNRVYGQQTNTYFFVGYEFHPVNYDINGNNRLDVDVGSSPEHSEYQKYIEGFHRDGFLNIFFVNSFQQFRNNLPTDVADSVFGRAFPNRGDAIVQDSFYYVSLPGFEYTNNAPYIIAHEIGHLLGLAHADNPKGLDPGTSNPAFLIQHHNTLIEDPNVDNRLMLKNPRIIAPFIERLVKQEWDIINPQQ